MSDLGRCPFRSIASVLRGGVTSELPLTTDIGEAPSRAASMTLATGLSFNLLLASAALALLYFGLLGSTDETA
jgi:hypothetical protein